jgi:hypothetical protein
MAQMPWRILFVSGYFPPFAPIGAVRAGKLAEHWAKAGHDVRVIAIALTPKKPGSAVQTNLAVCYLPYSEPGERITRLKTNFMRSPLGRSFFSPVQCSEKTIGHRAPAGAPLEAEKIGLLDIYRQFLQFPDSFKSWIAPAINAALSWQDGWKPDLIYSSGPPHSGHVVAARLTSRLNVPWIAEFRDLWVGDPYFERHAFIEPFHERLARKTLAKARACVVVTKAYCEHLTAITHLPILVSYNGFDPGDFAGLDDVAPLDSNRLTIVHAGVIYPGRRDPTPLFKAIAALGEDKRRILCLFYHDANESVAALAEQYGIRSCVEIFDAIPRPEILRVERQADILLECRWQNPAGDGVIPGKLFEYIGARRPILSIGSLTGESADIIRDNNLGLVSNDPEEIKAMLLDALDIKARLGRLPDHVAMNYDRFCRDIQFQKIDDLIAKTLRPNGVP